MSNTTDAAIKYEAALLDSAGMPSAVLVTLATETPLKHMECRLTDLRGAALVCRQAGYI